MKNIFLYISLFFFTITVKAHQPNVSTTMLVEKENNIWVLQISASLTAFQQEIKMHFSETPYKTPEEFQQMVIDHLKNNLDITINDTDVITLSNGYVKLGHDTKVVFELLNVPSEIKSVLVKNSAFKDIYKNQSALVLLKEGFAKEQFVLNKANNHTLNILVDENKFIVKTQYEASFISNDILYILLSLITIALIVMLLKKKSTNS